MFRDATAILGEGKSGTSITAEGVHNISKTSVAVKIFEKKNLSFEAHSQILRMVKAYQAFQHPGVVKLENYFETKSNYFFCLELLQNITLYDYVLQGYE